MTTEMEIVKQTMAAMTKANFDLAKAAETMKPVLENYARTTMLRLEPEVKRKNIHDDPLYIMLSIVAEEFDVTIQQLQCKSQKREIAIPRHIYLYLAIEDFHYQPTKAARRVNRTHCAAYTSVKACKDTHLMYDENERLYKRCKARITKALQEEPQPPMEGDQTGDVLPGSGHHIAMQPMQQNKN